MPRGPRELRCRRCATRKFRTARDLAEHILYKHGRVTLCKQESTTPRLPSYCEDSPSWTSSSAPIRKRGRTVRRKRAAHCEKEIPSPPTVVSIMCPSPVTPSKGGPTSPAKYQTICTRKRPAAVLDAVPNRTPLILDFTQDLF